MEITEVRVKLIDNKDERLKAFCSMTIDNDFVIRDIKVIEGTSGHFVAMPSRKMSDHCPKCGGKNHLRARFCNNCGASLSEDRARKDFKGRMKLHADIAHPINAECRQFLQDKIVQAFEEELEKSKLPGYKPVEFDEPDDDVPDEAAGHN
jgi:stage V sporulation protein G